MRPLPEYAESLRARFVRLFKALHGPDGRRAPLGRADVWRRLVGVLEDRLALARGVLVVLLCALAVVFAHDLLFGQRIVVEPLHIEGAPLGEAAQAATVPKPLSFYTGPIAGKDLFKAGQPVRQAESAGVTLEDATEVLSEVELLGILIDEKPQAVLEDKQAGKTYFLYEGDTFKDMVVERIMVGKVILRYKGRTLVLSL
jgi:hypothetical protein